MEDIEAAPVYSEEFDFVQIRKTGVFDEEQKEDFLANLKQPPDYYPVPEKYLIDVWRSSFNNSTSFEDRSFMPNLKHLSKPKIARMLTWYLNSTQLKPSGYFDQYFTYLTGKETIYNEEQMIQRDQYAASNFDAAIFFAQIMIKMANDYYAWNEFMRLPPEYIWSDNWEKTKEKAFVVKTQSGNYPKGSPEYLKAIFALSKQIPEPQYIEKPVDQTIILLFLFVDRAFEATEVLDGNVVALPAGTHKKDYEKFNRYLNQSGINGAFNQTQVNITNFLQTHIYTSLVKEFKDLDIGENVRLPFYTWWGQMAYYFVEKMKKIGVSLQAKEKWWIVNGWPSRDYSYEFFNIKLSDWSSSLGQDYRKTIAEQKKNAKKGVLINYQRVVPFLSRPPPTVEQEHFLDLVWERFPHLVREENLVWISFSIQDLDMIKSMTFEQNSFLPSSQMMIPEENDPNKAFWGSSSYVYLTEWTKSQNPNNQALYRTLQFYLYRIYLYSCVFHIYKGGRERKDWLWNDKGELVNPPPEEGKEKETDYERRKRQMKECLHRRDVLGETHDEWGKPIVCSDDRLFPKPWELKGEELDDYLDWAAPKMRVRGIGAGESNDVYSRKVQAYEQGYTAWRRMIKQNPAQLEEWPIGSSKDYWVETSPGKAEWKPVVNIFLTYGVVETHKRSTWEKFWKFLFSPVETIYGESLWELIFKMAQQVMGFLLEVFKVVVDVAKDAAEDLLELLGKPLLFAVGTVGGLILYDSIKK